MGNLMKNGVSYTGSMLGGSTKTFKGILEAGETSISFVDTLITGNSTIDYETSKLGVNPTNIEVANNAVTLIFAAQAEDIGIKVTISNDAAEPAPTKMRFLKATGQQYIELPDVRGNEGIKLEFYGYLADYYGGSQSIFGTQWEWDCLCVTNSAPSAGSIGIEWERNGGRDALTVPWNKPVYFVFDTNGEVRANEQVITFTPTTYSNNTLKLFCGGDGGAYKGFLWASEMKIYKNNVLVKDLIPTKIGGEACYYDVIGKKAYFSETSTPFQLEEIEYTPAPSFVEEYFAVGENKTFTVTNPGLYFLATSHDDSRGNSVTMTVNSSNLPYIRNSKVVNEQTRFIYEMIELNAGDTVNFYSQYAYSKYCVGLRIIEGKFNKLIGDNCVSNSSIEFTPNDDKSYFVFGGVTSASDANYDNSTITDPDKVNTISETYGRGAWRAIGCSGAGVVTLNMSGSGSAITSEVCIEMKDVYTI